MATYTNFEDLEIWKSAALLAEKIYLISDEIPLKHDFGMKDQIRRSAASISNNIAEGFEYGNNKDFIRFLRYAKGSTGEFRNQLILLFRANKIEESFYNKMYNDAIVLGKMIGSFMKYLIEFEKQKELNTKVISVNRNF
ncbi:four helix bundle protein [Solitalea canadensis]|uniref:S23 ribosomal protein n=1 Tax=Solitalea canadensis (strain ATCC 29591 / DSM 3403 / JCM 21819 / LMG 8368 / NBRC 15130 / NCIMB 12057 / USAM 9D) TaxID=929556 RepID=H8KNY5_SOLCM|nr:four helix bundle protein [Solitalea canadensis]AFD05507.1 S23 ribosomal protein [Solitalea canadensis DSM 3403]